MTPEAMRRLADLKLEKEYGILGDGKIVEVDAPADRRRGGAGRAIAHCEDRCASCRQAAPRRDSAGRRDGIRARTRTARDCPAARRSGKSAAALDVPEGVGGDLRAAGPLEAIKLYDALLEKYPHYANRDQVLYQKARAYDELGRTAEAMKVMEQLIAANPGLALHR